MYCVISLCLCLGVIASVGSVFNVSPELHSFFSFFFSTCFGSVLQRVGVCCGLSPHRQQHRGDVWQVPSIFLEPGERHAGQEAGTV